MQRKQIPEFEKPVAWLVYKTPSNITHVKMYTKQNGLDLLALQAGSSSCFFLAI